MQSPRVFANPPASSIQAAIKIATLRSPRKPLFLRKPPRSLWFSKLGYNKRLKDLFSYSEPLNDTAITFSVLRLNIVQKPASVAYHLEEASPGGMILLVSLEMFGEIVDSFTEQSDLNFRRSRIGGMDPRLADDGSLEFTGKNHATELL
jgi:hypothetical protein